MNVSFGRRLAEYPVIAVALLALRWLYGHLQGPELSVLLRSRYLGTGEPLERSRVELRTREWPDRHWDRELFLAAIAHDAGDGNGDCRDWADRWVRVGEALPSAGSRLRPSEWAETLDRILGLLNWPGDAPLDSDDYQLDNRWRSLLNEFARLELVAPALSGEEAIAQLAALANDTVFQPEAEGEVVSVLGPLEAAGLEFDALWISGMSADTWPPPGRPLALLSRELQRQHDMPDATPADTAEYARRVLDRLRSSADEYTISYPATIGDAEQLPTALLGDVVPEAPHDDPGWYANRLLDAPTTKPADPVPRVFADEAVAGGAATIQRQAHDPFSAFAYGRLGISPLQTFKHGIAAQVRGSLIHAALQKFYEGIPPGEPIGDWVAGEIDARVNSALNGAFRRYEVNADKTLRSLLRIERDRTADLLRAVVGADRARPPFTISSVESAAEVNIEGITLSLRRDRVDTLPTGEIVILDYKTGMPRKFLVRGEPRDLQLVVYAYADDRDVAGLGLFNVDAAGVAIDGAGPALNGPEDADAWRDLLETWKGQVAQAARELARGDVRLNAHQGNRDARPLNLLSRYTEVTRERR